MSSPLFQFRKPLLTGLDYYLVGTEIPKLQATISKKVARRKK